MTKYAASSVTAFKPGEGCEGHSITDAPADPDYPYLSIECPVCEPLVDPAFWATTAEERPLTAAEEKELERKRREAEERNIQMNDAMARVLMQMAAKELGGEEPAEPVEKSKPRTRKASGASA